ncbi:MAG: porin family protein [Bacteroidota bacterium]|nr:porin family protein [Bacteroidota bacterium]
MKARISFVTFLLICITASWPAQKSFSQNIQIGLYTEPLISWFSSDTELTANEGARPGLAFGLTIDRYFARNYAFSTGISIINASGRLSYSDTLLIRLKNTQTELVAGDKITYRIQYLSIPLGIKLKTNQIGYMTFFANAGLNPKIIIGGKADIPSEDIKKVNVTKELKLFNLGYNITAGMEYSLGGRTAVMLGLVYEDNFMDVTKDYSGQAEDKISHHMLRFRIGINF